MSQQDLTGHDASGPDDGVRVSASGSCCTGDSPISSGFSIDSPESANWLIRKIKESRAYADRVRAWAKAEVERAEKEEARLLDRFGHQLRQWVMAELDRHRSLPLPAGTVGIRAEPERIVVSDEPALIAWCKNNLDQAIRVRVDAAGA